MKKTAEKDDKEKRKREKKERKDVKKRDRSSMSAEELLRLDEVSTDDVEVDNVAVKQPLFHTVVMILLRIHNKNVTHWFHFNQMCALFCRLLFASVAILLAVITIYLNHYKNLIVQRVNL